MAQNPLMLRQQDPQPAWKEEADARHERRLAELQQRPDWQTRFLNSLPFSRKRTSDIELPLHDPHDMVELQLELLRRQFPESVEEAAVRPFNPLERGWNFISGDTSPARTWPWGTISYNPDYMEGIPGEEIGDILAHELTHVDQDRDAGWRKYFSGLLEPFSFGDSEREKEAQEAERRRIIARRDIPLGP